MDKDKETIAQKSDFRIDRYRSSKAGGQRGDKCETAVRITHVPSGLSASCEDERYQHLNKIKAFKILAPKVVEWWKRSQNKKEIEKFTKEVRVYNDKRNEAKDSLTGERRPMDKTLNGDYLDEFLRARILYSIEKDGI